MLYEVITIDKKKKFPATALLRALGYGRDVDILELFYERRTVQLEVPEEDRASVREVTGTLLATTVPNEDFEGDPMTIVLGEMDAETPIFLASDLADPSGGELIAAAGDLIDAELDVPLDVVADYGHALLLDINGWASCLV